MELRYVFFTYKKNDSVLHSTRQRAGTAAAGGHTPGLDHGGAALFFPEINPDRYPGKFKGFAQLILQVIPVGRLDILGVVAKKSK